MLHYALLQGSLNCHHLFGPDPHSAPCIVAIRGCLTSVCLVSPVNAPQTRWESHCLKPSRNFTIGYMCAFRRVTLSVSKPALVCRNSNENNAYLPYLQIQAFEGLSPLGPGGDVSLQCLCARVNVVTVSKETLRLCASTAKTPQGERLFCHGNKDACLLELKETPACVFSTCLVTSVIH